MKINDIVTIVVQTPWATTEEKGMISSIIDNMIYIDGLDIPFDKKTGYKTETFLGCSVYIKEVTNLF